MSISDVTFTLLSIFNTSEYIFPQNRQVFCCYTTSASYYWQGYLCVLIKPYISPGFTWEVSINFSPSIVKNLALFQFFDPQCYLDAKFIWMNWIYMSYNLTVETNFFQVGD